MRVPGVDRDRRPAVYGRAVPAAGGGTWLQYWLFYAQQDQVAAWFAAAGRWSDPDAWARAADDCRAECDSIDECDGREVAMGVGGAVAAAGLGGVLWARRRRPMRRA
jgi:hypothetical protein